MFKALLRPLIPPILLEIIQLIRGGVLRLRGPYKSWAAAVRESKGYKDSDLIEKIVQKNYEPIPDILDPRSIQTCAAIMTAINRLGKPVVRVLDIGGELGNLYRQILPLLRQKVLWTVLETEPMARKGNELFHAEHLSFTHDNSVVDEDFDIVIASGVLQVLEEPKTVFNRIRAAYVLISIFPFVAGVKDILAIRVIKKPPQSYPLWLFSDEWRNIFNTQYRQLMRWQLEKSDKFNGLPIQYEGFLLERKQ